MERGKNSVVCPNLIIIREPPQRRADGVIPKNIGYYNCRLGCGVRLDEFFQPISNSQLCQHRQNGIAFCKRIPTVVLFEAEG